MTRAYSKRQFHGMSNHPVYRAWKGARHRCESPKSPAYHLYGGRGIKLCERWQTFERFRDDMLASWEPGLTLDRRDNDGDYSPENCRWVSMSVQLSNRRQLPHGVTLVPGGYRAPVAFKVFATEAEAVEAMAEAAGG